MSATAQIVSFDIKKAFIRDRQIMSHYERQRNKILRRFGSIVRREARKRLKKGPRHSKVARGSKRKRKQFVSRAGHAPLTHSDEPNLRTIFYGLEKDGERVVIGPVKLSGTKGRDVPFKLEYGKLNRPFMNPSLEAKFHELAKGIEMFGLV